jgi:hypothetical protein
LVRALDAAGVPVIAPVDVFIAKPVGRVGVIPRVIGEVPPLAVTGVKLAATALAVKVSEVITSVVVRAAETLSMKVFELVAPLASVAVTV